MLLFLHRKWKKFTPFQTEEEHTVTHLQYVAWPDHGVPDDSTDFLEFVTYMRPKRLGKEPVLVHCRYNNHARISVWHSIMEELCFMGAAKRCTCGRKSKLFLLLQGTLGRLFSTTSLDSRVFSGDIKCWCETAELSAPWLWLRNTLWFRGCSDLLPREGVT